MNYQEREESKGKKERIADDPEVVAQIELVRSEHKRKFSQASIEKRTKQKTAQEAVKVEHRERSYPQSD